MEDERRSTALFDRHRRELHVHCHLPGSFDEAEDAVQDAFLRAWRARAAVARRPGTRQWAVPTGGAPIAEVTWLQPCPDALLDEVPDPADEPGAVAVARETTELALLAARQHLPARRRAVLVLRDVVGWRAAATAELLGVSVDAANGALQRARATLREQLPERCDDRSTDGDAADPAVARRFLAGLLAEHARPTMPPLPVQVHGRDAILDSWRGVLVGPGAWGRWRTPLTSVDRQPALAHHLRPTREIEFPDGTRARPGPWFERGPLDVLRIAGGEVAEVTTFDVGHHGLLGLPERLP